jgi:Histidine phosphatase superfamily (branch 1)
MSRSTPPSPFRIGRSTAAAGSGCARPRARRGQEMCAAFLRAASAKRVTAQKFSRPGSASPDMALSPLSARPIATGYLPRQEFEETADAFFAHPQQSVRGWEPAARAQARIVGAVERVASHPPDDDLAIVGHGGTGTLLYCHLAGCRSIGVMTSRRQTAETGLPLTGRPENFFAMAGNQSIRRQVQTHESVRPDQVSIVPSVTATASPPIAAPASSWSCTVTESVIRLGRAIS